MPAFFLWYNSAFRRRAVPVMLAVFAALCLTGCPQSPQYCCLQYDRNDFQATYCNNHSGAVGFYLETLDSDTARASWLDEFERFLERTRDCENPDCIAVRITEQYSGSEFADFYESEHEDAEQALAAQSSTTLDDRRKAVLINCGFADAVGRARDILKGE
jgi:hypothetical protein